MTKRNFRRILSLLCVAALLLGLAASAACSKKEGDGGTTEPTSAAEETPEDVYPFEGLKLSDYVTLGDYKGIQPKFQTGEFTEKEIQAEMAKYEVPIGIKADKSKTVVKDGDVVEFDYEGSAEGVSKETLQYMKDTEFVLKIGSGNFIDGFEEQIIGQGVGKEFKVNVTFPEDYDEELAGKDAVFTCTIHNIGTAAETDKAIEKWTQGYLTSIADFKEYVREEMLSQLEGNNVMLAFDTACGNAEITIPESEAEYYINMSRQAAESYGVSLEEYVQYALEYESLEEYREVENDPQVKRDIFAFAVAEKEGIEITEEDITDFLGYVRSTSQNDLSSFSDEALLAEYGKEYVLRNIMNELVAKFIYENTANYPAA